MPVLDRRDRILWAPDLVLLDADRKPVDPQPAPDAWEASFDDGQTWITGRAHPDHPTWTCWIIEGPEAPDGPAPDATLARGRHRAIIRLIDNPEAIHTRLPIDVT